MNHALLSASGSHKWLHCTPSARLEETFPESTSQYAEEGRLAHEIAELKLKKFLTPMSTRTYNSELKKLQAQPQYQDEMLQHTEAYLDYIKDVLHSFSSTPYTAVEKRIDFSHIAPEAFGTCDFIAISGTELHIFDFKYGKGVPVSAERNPQMMLYTLGALNEYSLLYAIDMISMHIIQPRLDNFSKYFMAVNEIKAWSIEAEYKAKLAWKGEGEFEVGDHCRFCRAKALCNARASFAINVEEQRDNRFVDKREFGDILRRIKVLKAWAGDFEEYVLQEAINGQDIEGFKLVEGRSNRRFIDLDKAFATLTENGIDEAMLYERKPITLSEVEKLVGKKKFEEILSAYVEKPQGAPTLVPTSDKRIEYKQSQIIKAFGGCENE